jgi:hypothetical protein
MSEARPTRISLQIEALELEGFPPARRHAIALACEHELARALTSDPLALSRLTEGGAGVPSIECASVCADPQGLPQAIGVAIAQAILGGMR